MRFLDPDPWSTCLAGKITVRDYADMVKRKDRSAIADLVHKLIRNGGERPPRVSRAR